MKRVLVTVLLGVFFILVACQQKPDEKVQAQNSCAGCQSAKSCADEKTVAAKVTFVELGSVNCIPCKAMQPVMKAIEADFGEQIHVVFYDVKDDPSMAKKYKIGLIPTQVFLDENGQEFHRHEGFYPEAEIKKILAAQGLSPKSGMDS